jgi:hypothetical protein
MSAVITERLGSFLKADLDPSVAASLRIYSSVQHDAATAGKVVEYHNRPKPLSLFNSRSGEKNMVVCNRGQMKPML